ncbi:PLP-dependent aminotransferase family protein [Zoogloea sp.]|uniref:MocR-like pyridoxine biosynthesis transcription factor PdxR n=1 Tax=Zoogloea sp. TaxID=49181 RepID=UPI001B775EE9|nr:PLP-dependent aminotransferase family protein [Zoogloea sp.]MBK6654965.1 PLP-dependent aminotransferase family protein [Zoogloea sp.]MBP7446314.1 PLP-dependent aminotransferase family protein [Zoogloea sp.]
MSLALVLAALDDPAAGAGEARQLRLYRLLKAAILEGRLAPGARLPGTRQLAADVGMARNCVLFAYQLLLAEGFVEADRGGTRVAVLPLGMAARSPQRGPAGADRLSRRAHQLPAINRSESLLPFAPGVPDLNAFPWATWARFLHRAWGEVTARQLAYAEPGGEPDLRRAVAAFLSARRGVACTPEQVFIVAGGQVALDACARLLADSGDTVWLENPCYPAARNVMLAAGLTPVAVDVDRDGMAPASGLWQAAPPRLVYVTPSHQYPLGSVLSLERRLALLAGVEAGGGWLIEDDYDSDFNHAQPGARPLPAIQGLRPEAPVIYVGTFSKLLYPGLRIAYMVVPRWAASGLGEGIRKLYRGGQAVEQRALARLLESGQLTRHLRRMAPLYRERQAALRAALQAGFGAGCPVLGGQAGLHLVLGLPASVPDTALAEAALEQGLAPRPLSAYYVGTTPDNGLVLGYGLTGVARIPELVTRLVGVAEKVRKAGGVSS